MNSAIASAKDSAQEKINSLALQFLYQDQKDSLDDLAARVNQEHLGVDLVREGPVKEDEAWAVLNDLLEISRAAPGPSPDPVAALQKVEQSSPESRPRQAYQQLRQILKIDPLES